MYVTFLYAIVRQVLVVLVLNQALMAWLLGSQHIYMADNIYYISFTVMSSFLQ